MPNVENQSKGLDPKRVSVSTTAANMLSSLSNGDSNEVKSTIERITSDIEDPAKVKKIQGYDDVFVARGNGMRTVFRRDGGLLTITSVSIES